ANRSLGAGMAAASFVVRKTGLHASGFLCRVNTFGERSTQNCIGTSYYFQSKTGEETTDGHRTNKDGQASWGLYGSPDGGGAFSPRIHVHPCPSVVSIFVLSRNFRA